jgi:hypothetical protein
MTVKTMHYGGFELALLKRHAGWVVHVDGIGITMCFQRVEDAIIEAKVIVDATLVRSR